MPSNKKTQYERIRDALMTGEILTSLGVARWRNPIMDLPKRISELRRDGYQVESVKRGRATGYYLPDKVDNRELAAWVAKPMFEVVA